MAETVVDVFEPVEVQEQDREQVFRVTLAPIKHLPEQLAEQRPIGKTRQRIVERSVAQLLLHGRPVRDVGLGARDPRGVTIRFSHRHATTENPPIGAVLMADAVLVFEITAFRLQGARSAPS